MSESVQPQAVTLSAAWGLPLEVWLCPQCDWRYLVPSDARPQRCPHCFRAALVPGAQGGDEPLAGQLPELVVPFSLSAEALAQRIQAFAKDIPFAPEDLKAQPLRSRLQACYLPLWMVDADAQAAWRAEVGFDYEVVSHQDRYAGGDWSSQRVQETRIRWEPRLGRLQRRYNNIAAPALDEDGALRQALGVYDMRQARPYDPALLKKSVVRLPNRTTEDAWPDTQPGLQRAAAQECQTAAKADYIRDFRWSPEFSGFNWTLLLQPVYATYYLDDDNQPQPVLIHGQTGRISGARRASLKRAQRLSLVIAAIALMLFVLSVVVAGIGLVFPPLLMVGGPGILIAVVVGLGALAPMVVARRFNRKAGG